MRATVADRKATLDSERAGIVRREAQRAADEQASADVWARWRLDRETREMQRRANAETEAREAANLPIFPRECAQRLAEETRAAAPDWRYIRPTLGAPWGRLLKAQPELSPELTKQREQTITAVFNSVPRALQASVNDLRALIDLLLMAHEAAAYQVGFEGGKLAGSAHVDARGRLRHGSKPARRQEPGLRLHDGSEGGAQ